MLRAEFASLVFGLAFAFSVLSVPCVTGIEARHTLVRVENITLFLLYSGEERLFIINLSDSNNLHGPGIPLHVGASYEWAGLEARILDMENNDVSDLFSVEVIPQNLQLSPIDFAHYSDGFIDLELPGCYDITDEVLPEYTATIHRYVFVRVSQQAGIQSGIYKLFVTYHSESQDINATGEFGVLSKAPFSITSGQAGEKAGELGFYIGEPVQIYLEGYPYWTVNVFSDSNKTELKGTAIIDGQNGEFVTTKNTEPPVIEKILVVALAHDDFTDFGQDPSLIELRGKWLNTTAYYKNIYDNWSALESDWQKEIFMDAMVKCLKFTGGAVGTLFGEASLIASLIATAAGLLGFTDMNPVNLMIGTCSLWAKHSEATVARQISEQELNLSQHVLEALSSYANKPKSLAATREILSSAHALRMLDIQYIRSTMRYMHYIKEDNKENPDYHVDDGFFANASLAVDELKKLRDPYDKVLEQIGICGKRNLVTPFRIYINTSIGDTYYPGQFAVLNITCEDQYSDKIEGTILLYNINKGSEHVLGGSIPQVGDGYSTTVDIDSLGIGNFSLEITAEKFGYQKGNATLGFEVVCAAERIGDGDFPSIIQHEGVLYALWKNGNSLYFKKSEDGGEIWNTERTIISPSWFNGFPVSTVENPRIGITSDGVLYITWNIVVYWFVPGLGNGWWHVLHYAISHDSGNTWTSAAALGGSDNRNCDSSSGVPDIHIVCGSYYRSDYFRYIKSIDNGQTWSGTSVSVGYCRDPAIAADDKGNVCVLCPRGSRIEYQKSMDNGETWDEWGPYYIYTEGEAESPEITADGNGVFYLVWQEKIDGEREVRFGKGKAMPESYPYAWRGVVTLSSDSSDSLNPAISVSRSGKNIYVVWEEQDELYFAFSGDSGENFSPPARLSNVPAGNPSVTQHGSMVYILSSANNRIYFLRMNSTLGELSGDVNMDCTVNIFDLAAVGLCYGCSEGQECWNNCEQTDVKSDGIINIFDLATIGLNYGKNC